jgi:hypothetical protein
MRARSAANAKPSVMRLKLECIRLARNLLPAPAKEPRRLRRFRGGREFPRGPSAAKVMNLAYELYGWISDERPRPHRRLKKPVSEDEIKKLALVAQEQINEEYRRKHEARMAELMRRWPDPVALDAGEATPTENAAAGKFS